VWIKSRIRATSDLVRAVDLLEQAATREGYRFLAAHPLFKYAHDAELEGAPQAVSLDFDVPRLDRYWPAALPETAWLLPVRFSVVPHKGTLWLVSPDPGWLHGLFSDPEGPLKNSVSWFAATQEIVRHRLAAGG